MTFSSIWLLGAGGAVALVVAVGLYRYTNRQRRLADFLGGRRATERLGRSRLQRLPVGRMILLGTAALLLGAAAAGPRWGDRGTPPPDPEPPPPSVVLAIDISASMQAGDVAPTRLGRAAEIARELLGTLEGARVGLTLFSGTPYVLAPTTEDHEVLGYLLDGVTPELVNIYDPGSLPSAALREATAFLAAGDSSESGVPGPRSIVVVGDGEAGEPLGAVREAAAAAAEERIAVHAVGVGTPEGGRMVLPAGYTPKGVDGSGPQNPMVSRLEEETLRTMAGEGGGLYVHADDAGGLARMYRTVGQPDTDPQPDPEGPFWASLDPAALFIGTALLALLVESLVGLRIGPGNSWQPSGKLRVGRAP